MKRPPLTVEEVFPDTDKTPVGDSTVVGQLIIRLVVQQALAMLESGELVVRDGVVVPADTCL